MWLILEFLWRNIVHYDTPTSLKFTCIKRSFQLLKLIFQLKISSLSPWNMKMCKCTIFWWKVPQFHFVFYTYSLSSYFRGTPNSALYDINNLKCHINLTYVFQFLIVFSPICMTYFTCFSYKIYEHFPV